MARKRKNTLSPSLKVGDRAGSWTLVYIVPMTPVDLGYRTYQNWEWVFRHDDGHEESVAVPDGCCYPPHMARFELDVGIPSRREEHRLAAEYARMC